MSRFRISLPMQMALATLFGVATGLFFGQRTSFLEPWGDAYIMILKITAIPYLIVAIIHGIAMLNRSQGLQILKKGSLFITLALFINVSMIYLMKWGFPLAEGQRQAGYVSREVPSLDFAQILIPHNIFYALANNIIPAIVVFSLLLGIAMMHIGDKQVIMSGLQTLLEALTKVTSWIARITPIGTFIIMANKVGTVHFSILKQMSTYFIVFVIGTSLITFWIVPKIASMLTPIKTYTWLKNLVPVLILAYTTSLVLVCIPYIIDIVKKETQALYPKDDNIQNQVQGTVSIIFNLPLGSMFLTAFVFFVTLFYGVSLDLSQQLKLFVTTFLTSLGAVGLGSWINSLTFILDVLGLPPESLQLYLAIVPFTSGFQSMLSAMEISTLALLITLAGRNLLTVRVPRLVFNSSLVLLPLFAVFGFLKVFDPLPHIKADTKTIYDLEIESDLAVNVLANEDEPPTLKLDQSTLQRILESKKLRVGYHPNAAPFCFFNKNQKLVGFDVAYAYQLAYDLGCTQIDFVPISHGKLEEQLNKGLFDIAMSAISISDEHLKMLSFPQPLIEAKIVFVTKDKFRKKVQSLDNIKIDRSLKIAVLTNSAYEKTAHEEFPYHEIVVLDSIEEFASEQSPAELLIWEEQEAIAWTVSHPQFQVVYPQPGLGKNMLGYAIRMGDPEFLCYLNSWLLLKQNTKFKDEQYHLWILGETHAAIPQTPRWSVFDDILQLNKKSNQVTK